ASCRTSGTSFDVYLRYGNSHVIIASLLPNCVPQLSQLNGLNVTLADCLRRLYAHLGSGCSYPTFARMHLPSLIGLAAAFCTTISYFPQLKKCWNTGSAGDLSLKMFSILAVGIALWVVYGSLQ